MFLDTQTLFAANAIILLMLAIVFAVAGRGRSEERYWRSWCLANLMIGTALVAFVFERQMPVVLGSLAPNILLVMGFGLRWRAAREFVGRPAPNAIVWGPALAFALIGVLTPLSTSYGLVYTLVNGVLAAQAFAVAHEFWQDRDEWLPSRYGLAISYGIMGASFAARVGQGLLQGSSMGAYLPHDSFLMIHLIIATIHTVSAGGFALSIAHERIGAGLRRAATHDFLTGIYNRGAFETACRHYLEAPRAQAFALVLIDLDHFKQINDRHGHAAGDAALKTCASLFSANLYGAGAVGRLGGEEFALLLADVSEKGALQIADRIRRTLAGLTMQHAGERFRLTISAGVAHSDTTGRDYDAMMQSADRALYAAKHDGRNRIRTYDQRLEKTGATTADLLASLNGSHGINRSA